MTHEERMAQYEKEISKYEKMIELKLAKLDKDVNCCTFGEIPKKYKKGK